MTRQSKRSRPRQGLDVEALRFLLGPDEIDKRTVQELLAEPLVDSNEQVKRLLLRYRWGRR